MPNNIISQIANQSETSKVVFEYLSARQRYRRITDLNKVYSLLMNKGEKLVVNDYDATFKALHKAGCGALVIGRNGNPPRFLWSYNLKQIGQAARNPKIKIEPIVNNAKKIVTPVVRRGRPPGTKNKEKGVQVASEQHVEPQTIEVTFKFPKSTNMDSIKALMELAKDVGQKLK